MYILPKKVGWAYFYEAVDKFSDSFKNQMSEQLLQAFEGHLGIDKERLKRRFMLMVGTRPDELNFPGFPDTRTILKDGYAFKIVGIIVPTSLTIHITAYWKTSGEVNLATATDNDGLNSSNIEFGWCTDFKAEDFLEYIKPRFQMDSAVNNLNFSVEYDYTLYPDLGLTFYLKNAVEEQVSQEIEMVLNKHVTNAYISEITGVDESEKIDGENQYFGIIDFQVNPYETGTTELLTALQEISKLKVGDIIEKVTIE